jgi:hypothetical protein
MLWRNIQLPSSGSSLHSSKTPVVIYPTIWHHISEDSLSLFYLLLPLWSTGHLWNALFHFSFLTLRQSVGLLGRGISPSQGHYLHKHKINADIHALNGISTHDLNVWASKGSSYHRLRGHCDQLLEDYSLKLCSHHISKMFSAFHFRNCYILCP